MDELASVFETVSRYFSILSEPVRVRIVHAICQEERSVSDIVAITASTQTTVSRHLAIMYREGVLSRRREGGFVHYKVSDTALAEICRTVCVHIASRDEAHLLPAERALSVAQAFKAPDRAGSRGLAGKAGGRSPSPGPKSASVSSGSTSGQSRAARSVSVQSESFSRSAAAKRKVRS